MNHRILKRMHGQGGDGFVHGAQEPVTESTSLILVPQIGVFDICRRGRPKYGLTHSVWP